MPQTATRTKSVKPAATKVGTPAVPRVVEVGKAGRKVLDKCANARQVRLNAEKVEIPLKQERRALIDTAAGGIEVGEVIVVEAEGVVRGRVSWRPSTTVNLALLLDAFPEAYTACVNSGQYSQFDPA